MTADSFNGPSELSGYEPFVTHIGEFAMMFPRVERHVTWAIESFTGTSRLDGNELEGMVQNFSSRIKILDIVSRPLSGKLPESGVRIDIVKRLRAFNAFRNNLFHLSATGFMGETNRDGTQSLSLMLKKLDGETGTEREVKIPLATLREKPHEMSALITDIKGWVSRLCPDAEWRVP